MKKIKNILNKKESQAGSIFLLVILAAMYLFENCVPKSIAANIKFIYIYKPCLWIIITALVLTLFKLSSRIIILPESLLIWWTMLLSSLYIFVNVFAGLVSGFGRSPYDHSASGILTNLLFLFAPLIGRELSRKYIIDSYIHKNYKFSIFIFSILFTILNIKLPVTDFNHFGSIVLPELSINFLASYLVCIGGPLLSIIYIGLSEGFLYLFPILPNLNWVVSCLIGTLFPLLSLLIIKNISFFKDNYNNDTFTKSKGKLSWILICTVSVLIIWFSAGAFPLHPMVMASGSMKPSINPGDIILVKKVNYKAIKKGDVVQFKRDNIFVFHRITDIVYEDGVKKYETKGDNNLSPDSELLKDTDIKGKVIYTIPKIGKPTLTFKQH